MRRLLLAATALATFAVPCQAVVSVGPPPQIAAIAPHDDGADYVWHVFCSSGLKYGYIPARQFPASARFEQVATPQTGDIAWWPEFVAIFVSENSSYITSRGFLKLADLVADGTQPRYYRMRLLPGEKPGDKPPPGTCERNLL